MPKLVAIRDEAIHWLVAGTVVIPRAQREHGLALSYAMEKESQRGHQEEHQDHGINKRQDQECVAVVTREMPEMRPYGRKVCLCWTFDTTHLDEAVYRSMLASNFFSAGRQT